MESRFSSLGMVLKLTNRKGKKFSVIVCDDELTDPYRPEQTFRTFKNETSG